jgi:hypothetical protein
VDLDCKASGARLMCVGVGVGVGVDVGVFRGDAAGGL